MIVEMINNIVSDVMPENIDLTKFLPFLGDISVFLDLWQYF